jgi:hypothetical protein
VTFVVSLDDNTPGARFDAIPWDRARIEESATRDGLYATIDTIDLATGPGVDPTGLDADPREPATRDITTSLAVLPAGWYRVVWLDANDNEQLTSPVYSSSDRQATELTSLAAVREFLSKQGGDTGQDEVLQSLISRASAAVMRHCRREFAPVTTAETRRFTWRGGPLRLAPYDLRAVDEIVLDPASSYPTTLAATEYDLMPQPTPYGVYRWVRPYGAAFNTPRTFTTANYGVQADYRMVDITGDWGFAEVPAEVEHWTIVTVASWYRRDVSAFSTVFRIDEERLERPEELPSAVVAGLAHLTDPDAP